METYYSQTIYQGSSTRSTSLKISLAPTLLHGFISKERMYKSLALMMPTGDSSTASGSNGGTLATGLSDHNSQLSTSQMASFGILKSSSLSRGVGMFLAGMCASRTILLTPHPTMVLATILWDGFNLSGQNITIDGYYGHNGDDCVSVVSGARNILAQNGFCGFSSHGLSIGSLGRNGANQTVKDVVFKNWTMDGAVYGARFKSWTGGQGFADNITWQDITVVNVSTAIFITQNYYDQDKGPRPDNVNHTSTRISNFLFQNFTGSLGTNWTDGTCISNPCWNHVDGGDATQAIIFDLFPDTAINLTFRDINVNPFKKSPDETTVICDPSALAPGEQDTLGFECTRGKFKATEIKVKSSNTASLSGQVSVPLAFAGFVFVVLSLFP